MGKEQWDIAGYHDNTIPIFSLYGALHCRADDPKFLAHLNALKAVAEAADGLVKSIVAGRDFDLRTGKWSIGNTELIALSEAVYPLQQKGSVANG